MTIDIGALRHRVKFAESDLSAWPSLKHTLRDVHKLLDEHERLIASPANAEAEARRRYDGDTIIDENTGEPTSFDDWGYAECQRAAFVDGAAWGADHPADTVWEYGIKITNGTIAPEPFDDLHDATVAAGRWINGSVVRRTKAGPWVPVETAELDL